VSIKEKAMDETGVVEERGNKGNLLTSGLTPKVLVISLAVILFVAIFNPEAIYYSLRPRIPDTGYLNPVAVFVMFLMMLFTFLTQKVGRRFAFTRAELITCYLMVTIGTAMTTFGSGYILTIMQLPRYFWGVNDVRMSVYYNETSSFIIPKSEQAVRSFLMGEASVPWGAWIVPIIMYTILGLAFFFVMIFFVSIVRKEWTEVQKLQYPLIVPIIEITRVGRDGSFFGGIWRNKLALLGMGISIFIGTMNGLKRYLPIVPNIGLLIKPELLLAEGDPFRQGLGAYPQLYISLERPLLLGVGYLVPSQVLFSIWFFGFLYKMWYVGIAAFEWYGGWGRHGTRPQLV
jgi:hypothetical protein